MINPDVDAVTPYEAFAIFPCTDCEKQIPPPQIVIEVIYGFLSARHDPDGLCFYCEECFGKHVPEELKTEPPQMELFS